jgi:hypothetical protein
VFLRVLRHPRSHDRLLREREWITEEIDLIRERLEAR